MLKPMAKAAAKPSALIDTRVIYCGDKRDRLTRKRRWELLDEDLTYEPNELDRAVVGLSDRSLLPLERAA